MGLIVEDDNDVRESIAAVAKSGYLVIKAKDADEAFRVLAIGGISVLLTDLQLSGSTDGSV